MGFLLRICWSIEGGQYSIKRSAIGRSFIVVLLPFSAMSQKGE